MADFSALKTAIQANIRTNANEEITGAILQEILLSMVTTMGDGAINGLVTALQEEVVARQNAVGGEATARQDADAALSGRINAEATARQEADSSLSGRINAEGTARGEADTLLQNAINGITTRLNEGYVYVGIATPSTNPGTPAGKVFYIALQAGTYTNFSSLAVTQGINILKYNGSAWSQEQLVGIDDVPTAGSNNLVKSGGIYKSTESLFTDIYGNDGTLYSFIAVDNNSNIGVGLTSSGQLRFMAGLVVGDTVDMDYSFALTDENGNIGFAITNRGKCLFVPDDSVINLILPVLLNNLPTVTNIIDDNSKIPTSAAVYNAIYNVPVWSPKNIFALDGTTVQLFKNSIVDIVDSNNYELRLADLTNVTNSAVFGYNYDFCYEYSALGTNPNFGFRLAVFDSMLKKIYLSPQITNIINVKKGVSPSSVKNVLCIGDSFTDADYWVSELRRLLTGEVSSGYSDTANSPITADSLTNINFIGTKDTGQNQTPNEGWSGQHYRFFAGGGSDTTQEPSPFINPNTNEVDFDYYMGTGNIRGSLQTPSVSDKIDFAIIVLGTNGNDQDVYVKAIWDGLLAHNPNIKVIISCRCMGTTHGIKANIIHYQTYFNLSSDVFASNARFEALCDENAYKDNFLYVDYNIRFDALNNMPVSIVQANIRNNSDYAIIKRGQNNVHPSKEGYFQMADAFRGAFHYWFLNSNN